MTYTAQQAAAMLLSSASRRVGEIRADDLAKPARQSAYTIVIPLRGERALAYNTDSQAFAVWEREDIALWSRFEDENLPTGHLSLRGFLEGGFVVPDGCDELARVRAEYESARFDLGSMILTIAPTLNCNFGCSYCFQGLDKPTQRITPSVKHALLNYLETKVPNLRQLGVAWYGGEPLMDRATIFELSPQMITLCEQHNVNYTGFIVTNGYFLDRVTAEKLTKCKVTTAQVTIDGAEEWHDSRRHLTSGKPTYDRILKNLEEVLQHTTLQVVVRVNVDVTNADGIRRMMDDLSRRGLSSKRNFNVYFAPVEAITTDCNGCADDTMAKAEYGRLEAELIEYAISLGLASSQRPPKFLGTCQAVRPNGLVVVPNGDIHKCWDTVMHRELRVGTVFDAPAGKNSALHKKWMHWTPFDNPICRECKILPSCAGACAFKFVHSDQGAGEAGKLPCPSWKFNIGERLFLRAKRAQLVTSDDWDQERSPTVTATGLKTGGRHSHETVAAAARALDRAVQVHA